MDNIAEEFYELSGRHLCDGIPVEEADRLAIEEMIFKYSELKESYFDELRNKKPHIQ